VNDVVREFFAKAAEDLSDAEKIFAIGLLKSAARSAYYSCLHSCEGFIFHKTGKRSKTHSGVRSEFARLTKDIPGFDRSLTSFLAQPYTFKELNDYGIGDQVSLSSKELSKFSRKRGSSWKLSGHWSTLKRSRLDTCQKTGFLSG